MIPWRFSTLTSEKYTSIILLTTIWEFESWISNFYSDQNWFDHWQHLVSRKKFQPVTPKTAKVGKWYHVSRSGCFQWFVKRPDFFQGNNDTTIVNGRFWRCPLPKRTCGSRFGVETNSSPLKINGWKMKFPFGARPIFRGEFLASGGVSQQVKSVDEVWLNFKRFLAVLVGRSSLTLYTRRLYDSMLVVAEQIWWLRTWGFV